jgi:hypothetical protein
LLCELSIVNRQRRLDVNMKRLEREIGLARQRRPILLSSRMVVALPRPLSSLNSNTSAALLTP